MMTFALLENRPSVKEALMKILGHFQSIEIHEGGYLDFIKNQGLDALLVLGIFAHERYGGKPLIRVSQILSTNHAEGITPWVITTPPFPAKILANDNSLDITIKRKDDRSSPAEEDYVVFDKVFKAVKAFNILNKDTPIIRVGCDLEFIKFPLSKESGTIISEVLSLKQAYEDNFIHVK